jgi:hypothetical protein
MGLALVIYLTPTEHQYRALDLADGEQVAAFRGTSHELITLRGGPRPKFRGSLGIPVTIKETIHALTANGRWLTQDAPADNSVYLCDLDGRRRKLNVRGLGPAYGVAACPGSERLAIEYGVPEEPIKDRPYSTYTIRIVVVDGQSGKLIRTVTWITEGFPAVWGISDTYRYVDVDSGKSLYEGEAGMLSPDAKYLWHTNHGLDSIWNLDESKELCTFRLGTRLEPDGVEERWSPHSDLLIDEQGEIRELHTARVIGGVNGNGVFADGGTKIAWLQDIYANEVRI